MYEYVVLAEGDGELVPHLVHPLHLTVPGEYQPSSACCGLLIGLVAQAAIPCSNTAVCTTVKFEATQIVLMLW